MKKILLSSVLIFSALNAGGYIVNDGPTIPVKESVLATGNFYIGGALSLVSARENCVDLNFFSDKNAQDRLANIMLLAGYNFNKYVAVEGRVSTTIANKDFAKLTSLSLFLKPQYPVTKELNIYALLGYGHVKLDNNNGSNVDVSKSTFQWGLGASYNIDNNWAVFADYTNLGNNISGTMLNSNEADIDSINVGVTYKF